MPRVQFYGYDKQGNRRILSFEVKNKQEAIKALKRMNRKSGWYKPINDIRYSEKIEA